MLQYAEKLTLCSLKFAKLPETAVDVLSATKPLSNSVKCIYDESYLVCIGDWIYIADRRLAMLKPVNDWHTLFFILRSYTNFIVSNVNPRARGVIDSLLKGGYMKMGVYYKEVRDKYRGIEFTHIVIFSDAPCLVYLFNGSKLVGSVDVYKCRLDDEECMSLLRFVEEAVAKFKVEI